MKDVDPKLTRLLRSAAEVRENGPTEAPFGFDTRVVALWRAGVPNENNGLGRLLRRVAVLAVAVIAISSAAVVYELNQESAADELFTNAYAIADSAIETEVP
jgi:hypothetical protein